jgi:hypothetical protein
MIIAKVDVHEEELSVKSSKNRIIIFEKTNIQKRFESWFNQGLQTKAEKRLA